MQEGRALGRGSPSGLSCNVLSSGAAGLETCQPFLDNQGTPQQ